jgi:hypothetical protein
MVFADLMASFAKFRHWQKERCLTLCVYQDQVRPVAMPRLPAGRRPDRPQKLRRRCPDALDEVRIEGQSAIRKNRDVGIGRGENLDCLLEQAPLDDWRQVAEPGMISWIAAHQLRDPVDGETAREHMVEQLVEMRLDRREGDRGRGAKRAVVVGCHECFLRNSGQPPSGPPECGNDFRIGVRSDKGPVRERLDCQPANSDVVDAVSAPRRQAG